MGKPWDKLRTRADGHPIGPGTFFTTGGSALKLTGSTNGGPVLGIQLQSQSIYPGVKSCWELSTFFAELAMQYERKKVEY